MVSQSQGSWEGESLRSGCIRARSVARPSGAVSYAPVEICAPHWVRWRLVYLARPPPTVSSSLERFRMTSVARMRTVPGVRSARGACEAHISTETPRDGGPLSRPNVGNGAVEGPPEGF